MKSMKMCFIVGAFPKMKCGIGDYTCKLAEEFAKQGNEVHIITSKHADTSFKALHIHNIAEKWDFSEYKAIIKKVKEIKPDIVNIQYPSNEYKSAFMLSLLPFRLKQKFKCKVTATVHEYDYEEFSIQRKFRLYLNFSKLDKIIVAAEEFINKIKLIVPKADIVYIPISSNIPKSKIKEEEKDKLLEKYNLKEKVVISYFGFARASKGIEYLLECMKELPEDVSLLYIGTLEEKKEYEKSLLDLIEALNIKDRITITGLFDNERDVADLLQISELCVLPFTEGVQTRNGSFLAAYNQKLPVITTSKEKEDSRGIYYVEPKNQKQLLEKIKNVLENKEEFERDELTWENVAKEYMKNF